MPSTQQITDDIRAFLSSTDQRQSADLEEMARGYADACRRVNARLRRCADLIGRGLVAEAVHEAEEAPVLLDEVAALDLPEIDAWEETCQIYDLPRPQRLSLEAASELNDAYSIEQPLRVLLDNQRLLVLARAPVRERLEVARQLMASDVATPHWAEDVAVLEKERFRQIEAEAAAVIRQQDVPTASRLVDDLEPSQWSSPPPKQLVRRLRSIEVRAAAQVVIDAHERQDIAELRSAVNAFKYLLKKRGIKVDDELAVRVATAESWLAAAERDAADTEEFSQLCWQLQGALTSGNDPALIQALYQRASTFNRPLPQELQQKYDRWASNTKTRRRRAAVWTTAAVVGFVILGMGGLMVLHNQQAIDREAGGVARQIEFAVEAREWEQARQLLETAQATPEVADHAVVRLAANKYDAAWSAEEKRRADLTAAMDAARAAAADGRPVRPYIERAEEFAIDSTERLEVTRLRRDLAGEEPNSGRSPSESQVIDATSTPSSLAPVSSLPDPAQYPRTEVPSPASTPEAPMASWGSEGSEEMEEQASQDPEPAPPALADAGEAGGSFDSKGSASNGEPPPTGHTAPSTEAPSGPVAGRASGARRERGTAGVPDRLLPVTIEQVRSAEDVLVRLAPRLYINAHVLRGPSLDGWRSVHQRELSAVALVYSRSITLPRSRLRDLDLRFDKLYPGSGREFAGQVAFAVALDSNGTMKVTTTPSYGVFEAAGWTDPRRKQVALEQAINSARAAADMASRLEGLAKRAPTLAGQEERLHRAAQARVAATAAVRALAGTMIAQEAAGDLAAALNHFHVEVMDDAGQVIAGWKVRG